MPRNLDRRIELLIRLKMKSVRHGQWRFCRFNLMIICAHLCNSDGTYKKPDLRGVQLLDAQIASSELAIERAEYAQKEEEALSNMGEYKPIFEGIDQSSPDLIDVSYDV